MQRPFSRLGLICFESGWRAVCLLAFWLGLCPAGHSADATADLHIFTDAGGRTLKAAVTGLIDNSVLLKREDGQDFKITLSTLSKDDQSYARLWYIQQAQARKDSLLAVSMTTSRTNPATVKDPSGVFTTATWNESYKLKIKNTTPVHWTGLQVRYIIFQLAGVQGAMPPNNFTPVHKTGTSQLDDLPSLQEKSVATDRATLQETALVGGTAYASGAPGKVTDRIQGLWVRIYDDSNNLLQEWASTQEIMKNYTWDSAWLPAARRGGARPANPATSSTRGSTGRSGRGS